MRYPRIGDDEYLELNPTKSYDCPYIQGWHRDDKIILRGLDGSKKVWDFAYH